MIRLTFPTFTGPAPLGPLTTGAQRAAVALILLAPMPVLAQSVSEEDLSSQRLDEVERALSESEQRLESHKARYAELIAEMERLRGRSVQAALDVQTREARLTRIETRLGRMLQDEIALVDRLKTRQEAMISILAALQSMERNKPPALLVQPNDAVEAARSAMLLGAVIPDIHEQAEALGQELDQLTELRTRIEAERDDQKAAGEALRAEKGRLEGVLAEKERLQKATQLAVEAETQRVARFAAQARTLRGVVEELERQGAAINPRLKPGAAPGMPGSTPPTTRLEDLKGRLRAPVAGRVILAYGDEDATGSTSEGLTFMTRAGAQVVAPFDSKVVFAQPYRTYGQVLILATPDGYHFVLTGLDRIYGVVGQQLLAGEPVGAMGAAPARAQPVAQRSGETTALTGPTLYFELRRDGAPVDPLPWLSGWTRPATAQ